MALLLVQIHLKLFCFRQVILLELWCSTDYFYQNRKLQPGSEQASQNEPAEDPASSQRAAAAEQAAHTGSTAAVTC